MNSTDIIRDYIDNQLGYTRTIRNSSLNMDEIILPSGENVIISYADVSITGIDQSHKSESLQTRQLKPLRLHAPKENAFFV